VDITSNAVSTAPYLTKFCQLTEIWLALNSYCLLSLPLYIHLLHSNSQHTAYQLYTRPILSPSSCTGRFSKHFLAVYISHPPPPPRPRQPMLHTSNCLSSLHHKTYPQFRQFSLQLRSVFLNLPFRQCLTTTIPISQQRCCWRFSTSGCDAMSTGAVIEVTDQRTAFRVKWSTLLAMLYPYARRLIFIHQQDLTRHKFWTV
jgi:hypothetical protein